MSRFHPHPPPTRTLRVAHALLLGTLLVACGPAAPRAPTPEPAAPRPGGDAAAPELPGSGTGVAGPLRPSEAELRAAEWAELTGTELGTMWTFENPPLDYWGETYGFAPDSAWLDHVRLASVRYGEHCSASFVSPGGLVLTNWHCVLDCAEALSEGERDYVVEGFYAAGLAEEQVCPGLFLDQLVAIEDVTSRVRAAAPAGAAPADVTASQERVFQEIEGECAGGTDEICQVVELFHGGQYQLYRYRRFEPVKLVFAPERQAGFFGGDPDNFTYPRYNLDVAFVRAYEAGGERPARTPEHLSWSPEGASEGDLVLITGNPGSTSRLITVSELLYEQRFEHPFTVAWLSGQRDLLREVAASGPEAERSVREPLFEIENSLKAYTGQLEGLLDTLLVGRKIRWEREFRDRVAADAGLEGRYGELWDSMAVLQVEKLRLAPVLYFASPGLGGIPHVQVADALVDHLRAAGLPPERRAEALPEGGAEALAESIRGARLPPARAVEPVLALRLGLMRSWLGELDALVRVAFQQGESPEAAARRLLTASSLADATFREGLLSADAAVLDTLSDPLLRMVAAFDSAYRGVPARWEEVLAAEEVLEQHLAEALFAAFGTDIPPDATFTLRISDGLVARYPYNGTFAPPHTTFHGLFERALAFGNEEPWTLPAAFMGRRDAIEPATPLNFVTTNDITGGNSGSPMVDREARVVGVAFDSNIEGLPNQFLFRTVAARTVGVHSAGILEALRTVYGASGLVAEILGQEGTGR